MTPENVRTRNIFIRALIKPQGAVGPVLTWLRDGDYVLLYADPLLDELVEKLALPRMREKYHLSEDIETVLALILLRGRPITPQRRVAICRDPKDDSTEKRSSYHRDTENAEKNRDTR